MKKAVKYVAAILCLALVAVVAYVAYVWFSYSRIPDGQSLATRGAQTAQIPAGKTLSAMTMNIGFGAYTPEFTFFMDGGRSARAESQASVERATDGVAQLIRQHDPELVLLQEVDVDSDRSHHVDQQSRIAAACPDYASVFAYNYNSAYLFYPLTEPIGQSKSGIMTLSKYGIESSRRVQLPLEEGFGKLFDLDRCFTVTRLPVDNGRQLTLINTHASAYAEDAAVRQMQLETLVAALKAARDSGDYVICAGDFNRDLHGGQSSELFGFETRDEPWLQALDVEGLPEGMQVSAPTNAPTVRDSGVAYEAGITFGAVIDGFITSEDVEVLSVETIDDGFTHSDHNPVLLQFLLMP